MRLGDLDDLKVHISELMLVYSGTELDNAILNAIDNAPTVEKDILFLCDHKRCGDNFNCYECNHTTDIRHAINFDLMEFPRSVFVERIRPQGEWIYTPDIHDLTEYEGITCSLCGNDSVGDFNFCPTCGAEMRKGGEYE